MKLLKSLAASLCAAFSAFSIIPMPRTEWNRQSLRFMLCFFPLVGLVQALALYVVLRVCVALQLNYMFTAVLATLVPVVVSGGIHLDGFADTTDAIASHGTKSHKLCVLHDSHIGTFAVIALIAYFLLYAGMWTELWEKIFLSSGKSAVAFRISLLCGTAYVFERALSAFAVVAFPKAGMSGLAVTFARHCSIRAAGIACAVALVSLLALGFCFYQPAQTACVLIMQLLLFAFYYGFSQKYFGGVTGDLAGWYVQVAEIAALSVPAIVL